MALNSVKYKREKFLNVTRPEYKLEKLQKSESEPEENEHFKRIFRHKKNEEDKEKEDNIKKNEAAIKENNPKNFVIYDNGTYFKQKKINLEKCPKLIGDSANSKLNEGEKVHKTFLSSMKFEYFDIDKDRDVKLSPNDDASSTMSKHHKAQTQIDFTKETINEQKQTILDISPTYGVCVDIIHAKTPKNKAILNKNPRYKMKGKKYVDKPFMKRKMTREEYQDIRKKQSYSLTNKRDFTALRKCTNRYPTSQQKSRNNSQTGYFRNSGVSRSGSNNIQRISSKTGFKPRTSSGGRAKEQSSISPKNQDRITKAMTLLTDKHKNDHLEYLQEFGGNTIFSEKVVNSPSQVTSQYVNYNRSRGHSYNRTVGSKDSMFPKGNYRTHINGQNTEGLFNKSTNAVFNVSKVHKNLNKSTGFHPSQKHSKPKFMIAQRKIYTSGTQKKNSIVNTPFSHNRRRIAGQRLINKWDKEKIISPPPPLGQTMGHGIMNLRNPKSPIQDILKNIGEIESIPSSSAVKKGSKNAQNIFANSIY
ncbi:unnamed protein product [Moneuplotes crassus]|uniref:Uncharacterized protein n=1 Tax=Euplotes crassus TaxID=5936 RepID=A0AAD2D3K7_EUPCR|nr:unnamed protein product [Moneuplotes crassus]